MARLLTSGDIRTLSRGLAITPTKKWGQNFVVDANTVRRIAAAAKLDADDVVMEVGPGLGSLTLALIEIARRVIAVEIDPKLALALPTTVAHRAPEEHERLTVIETDAARIAPEQMPEPPTALVANLPYNVAVPVVLHALEVFPSLEKGLVMVQAEVGDRLTAGPGSKIYGAPSVKMAWYAKAKRAGSVSPNVFWPVPNVASGLVAFERIESPKANRREVFGAVDAAFGQRRKMLRQSLKTWAGESVDAVLDRSGIEPTRRGESLDITEFIALADAKEAVGAIGPRSQEA
ncbi:16S rRNA (adenine(1518)-N(6)/adenine(1519)-N(6))-dimethyltransferase RsmA [Glycomyces sp. TRM65418]|uniref:16S rRNA (adenine(1518)-N(6)/adenine(1519)-N(6))- dimethyltransferase RsmA n=1 Tax=Glycomyces sp. TRM65418 TaxID=2867006 RepID=UPI001CE6765F|nr:16S rRNA (adenine(1518)-N(6)/adenine(1519)-N(6))-dimethyltransferase RsmA [Glycomyces sp. TRM65418]MCC3763991.1 16S rRNA (adenine(1518)-N(6)/adenine(1519)-N(6))-dimethyltransferase RsmA [Glycomyces sp. TRM65418]QZD53687.1 16S rRNA (adenine(1518)-N(6)/adenine(1519)-N(6))-dimethyltransferase RsmA [Glycomyces sp. TRM65418]